MSLVRMFLPLFVLQASATLAVASEAIGDSVCGDLHWGENLSLDGYRLVAADFSRESSRPSALLKLYQGDELLMQQPLCQGENFTFDDTVVVEADGIFIPDLSEGSEDSTASVRLALSAAPRIRLHLISDKDSYDPGDEIRLRLIAENEGSEAAEGIRINLSSQPEFFHFNDGISELEAGKSCEVGAGGEEKLIRLKAPLWPGPAQIQLRAKARYSDSKGMERESAGHCIFGVFGQISLHKSAMEEMIPGKEYPVILTLRNFGQENVSVNLADSVSDGFCTNSDMKWKLEVKPREIETVSYDIEPSGPGAGFILPAAVATYNIGNERYESRSESISADVAGPFLEVEKKISSSIVYPGDEISVSIDVFNRGNRTVKASLNESVPAWARFMGGETHSSQILNSAEEASLRYRISCNRPGNYEIPETKVFYADARGDQYSINSSCLSLKVLEEKPHVNMTAVETAPRKRDISASSANLANLKYLNNSTLLVSSTATFALIYLLLGRIL